MTSVFVFFPLFLFAIALLLSAGEVSLWSVSVGEGFPQRHQGYQTQQGQIWARTSSELRGGPRDASVVADEDGFIQKTRSATVQF